MNNTYDLAKLVSIKFVEKTVCKYYSIDPEVKLFGKVIFPISVKGVLRQYYSLKKFKEMIKEGEIDCLIEDNVIYQKPFVSLKFVNNEIREKFFDDDDSAIRFKDLIVSYMVNSMEFDK